MQNKKGKGKQTSIKQSLVNRSTLFESAEKAIGKTLRIWQIALTLLSLILCFFMFDAKISIGHDDSLYIMAAHKYASNFFGYWYSDNAPLYVIFLALPIHFWGLNLMLLKLLSVLFFTLSVWVLFAAFRGRIPNLLLLLCIFIYGSNAFALSYASLTYTEAFFLFIQSIFFWLFFNHLDRLRADSSFSEIRKSVFRWISLGAAMFLLYFTKTVAIGIFLSVAAYFLLRREWKNATISTISFGIIYIIIEGLKKILWGSKIINFSQSNILFLKDAYDPSKGKEDVAGFIERFFGNIVIYLSGRLWEILGFRKEDGDFSKPIAFFTVVILIIGLIMAFKKKHKFLQATSLYVGVFLVITFFALQTSWGQGRLIMVYMPFLLMLIFFPMYSILERPKLASFQILFFFVALVFLWNNSSNTLKKSLKNIPIVKKNLVEGDKFEGYTDDYKNFLKLSEWCADSLPIGSFVASRKAPMSFVYGRGKEFYPIYKVTKPRDADSILQNLKKAKVTHVIFANLRLDPKRSGDVASVLPGNYPKIYAAYLNSDQKSIINTMQNYFSPVVEKYPYKFQLIKQIGTDEEAILYKINY